MKNALILHGTAANPHSNWFDWLKTTFKSSGYEVWVPQLPNATRPDMDTYREFIFASDFDFTPETVVIGHSSGAVATLSLLEALPETTCIATAVLVGMYRPELHKFSSTSPLNTEAIRGKAKRFVFIHSDNDPYCPLEDAKYLCEAVGGELVVLPNRDHFSYELNPMHTQLPELESILQIGEPHEN